MPEAGKNESKKQIVIEVNVLEEVIGRPTDKIRINALESRFFKLKF